MGFVKSASNSGGAQVLSKDGEELIPAICNNLVMCGRYRLSRRKQLVDEYFGSISGEEE
jgi:hypothetical protein